ncbi:MAG TPA: hypothetical protein ENK27_01310 [Desulfobulbus sp.]|nr:hypothetical protein [Desulfobulbus sp.]
MRPLDPAAPGRRHRVLLPLLLPVLACLVLFSVLAGCTAPSGGDNREERGAAIYRKIPAPPSRQQCEQCHPVIANLLRTNGGKHGQLDCRQCHLRFHTYEPGKTRRKDILPKCTRCHDHPHGPKLTHCTSCHQQAHTPLDIPASRALANGCYVCHPKIDKEIKTFTTQHTRLYCTACHHTRHGYKPQCTQCHQPHRGTPPMATAIRPDRAPLDKCTNCHNPHKALKVHFPPTTPNTTCALCHRNAYTMLRASGTKHAAFHCVKCHPGQHKTIKRCRQCHGIPHPPRLIKNFRTCGSCHGVAHSIVR